MSCEKCEEAQKEPFSYYYRWKDANIEVRGCREHIGEIFEALNKIQKGKKDVGLDKD